MFLWIVRPIVMSWECLEEIYRVLAETITWTKERTEIFKVQRTDTVSVFKIRLTALLFDKA